MKLVIDRENKIVKPEGKINLKKFLEEVRHFLPDWEEYDLAVDITISMPNTAPKPYPLPYPWTEPYPWAEPYKYPPLVGDPYQAPKLPPYEITFCAI
jgi:hypothetical protein